VGRDLAVTTSNNDTSFDVSSTADLTVGMDISWSVTRFPIFTGENINNLQLYDLSDGSGGYDLSLTPPPDSTNIVVGMRVSSDEIPLKNRVTVIGVWDGGVTLDQNVAIKNKSGAITFTSPETTISAIPDANTVTASRSCEGLTTGQIVTFGGGENSTTTDVTGTSVTQSSANVIIAGTWNVTQVPTTNTTAELDINELITINT